MSVKQRAATWSFAICALLVPAAIQAQASGQGSRLVAANDVTWNSLGSNENDSMPIGNGSLAANVWTEQNGDIVLLLSSPDAWTETGKLVKLDRIRITTTPKLFSDASDFHQSLRLEDGAIEIQSASNTARIWVDANHPALYVELHAQHPTALHVALETWRKDTPLNDDPAEKAGMNELGSVSFPTSFQADTIVPNEKTSVTWYHFNQGSIYPTVLEQEHLQSLLAKYPDPLLHRCFGGRITGRGLHVVSPQTLESDARSDLRLDITALAEGPISSPGQFLKQLDALTAAVNPGDLRTAWAAHVQWWRNFWDRSWISVTGDDDARKVTQGYAMQRYMMAWPKDWSAGFKLHAPMSTTIQGRVEQGRLVQLAVTPKARARDVEVIPSDR